MCSDILISLHPKYCDKVMAGIKTVELRRRRLKVSPGTRVWIYTKRPRACIDAVAVIESIHEGSHNELWRQFGNRVAISRLDFNEYLAGASGACAIVLRSVHPLKRAIGLEEIRQEIQSFHPPQFFKRLLPHSKELALLSQGSPVC
ncbi:MAG: ASCH domain-containing protein [Terriglobia bacterium]